MSGSAAVYSSGFVGQAAPLRRLALAGAFKDTVCRVDGRIAARKPRRTAISGCTEVNGVDTFLIPERIEVLLVGANSGLGLLVAKELSAAGIQFAAIRSGMDELDPQLSAAEPVHIFPVDVRQRDDVFAAVRSAKPRVIVSCLGGRVEDDSRPDLAGYKNLVEAAEESKVQRFVMVSALGAGESEKSIPFQVMDAMRPLLMDKSLAEQVLKSSGIPYVILRPGPLQDEDASGTGILTESLFGYGTISRSDLASLLCRSVHSDTILNKTFTALDKQRVLLTSPYVRPLEFWEPLPFEEFAL